MELQLVFAQKWVSESYERLGPLTLPQGSSEAVHFTLSSAVGFHLCKEVLRHGVVEFSWEMFKTPLKPAVPLLQTSCQSLPPATALVWNSLLSTDITLAACQGAFWSPQSQEGSQEGRRCVGVPGRGLPSGCVVPLFRSFEC